MRLRICHLGKFYPPAPGGMESHVQVLARAQAALGADVSVWCVNHAAASGEDRTFRALGTTATAVEQDGPVRVTRFARAASVARLDVCPTLPAALWRRARAEFDLLHLHAPNPLMTLSLVPARGLPPIVVTHHSDVVRQRVLGRPFRLFERHLYGRAAAVIATSEAYAQGSPLLRSLRRRVDVVPLGIDLTPFLNPSERARAAAEAFRARHGAPLWLCVGRLVYYKGLRTALAALPQVPGHLLIVGTGPLREALMREARRLGVAARVTFAGHLPQDELAGAFRAATALWFPSTHRSEAFGLAQVEAMASGCPVINTRIEGSGVAWVSRDGETGLTVPPGGAHALASAARRLLETPGLRERFAEAGMARAIAEFGDRAMAARTLAIYERLLVGGTRAVPASPAAEGAAG